MNPKTAHIRAEKVKNSDGTHSVRVFHQHGVYTEVNFSTIAHSEAMAEEYTNFKNAQNAKELTINLPKPPKVERPSIAELELLLEDETKDVQITPDGRVVATDKVATDSSPEVKTEALPETKSESIKPTAEELKAKRRKAHPVEVPMPDRLREALAVPAAESSKPEVEPTIVPEEEVTMEQILAPGFPAARSDHFTDEATKEEERTIQLADPESEVQ